MDSRIKKRAVLISAIMVLLVVFVTFLGNMSRMKSLFGKDQSEDASLILQIAINPNKYLSCDSPNRIFS